MNELLKAEIIEANLEVIDINGFKYNRHVMRVKQLDRIDVYIPVYIDISEGDCFESTKWMITCLTPKKKPIDVAIRVDKLDLCNPDEFEMSEYLNGKVTGLFCISDKCVLKAIGPDKIPFFTATLKVKNPFDEAFDMFILGFSNKAKKLSTIKRQSVIECTVTVKRRRSGEGWEFPVSNVEVKAEGK